jgi:SAM-dependent methyltransferase
MSRRVERPGVREGYDRWSESYDATPNPLVALDRRVTISAIQAGADERVLDAGCGTGAYLAAISQARSAAFGLDFSRGMLRVARQAAPKAHLVQADLNQPFPVRRGAFHVVLSALVSEHLSDLRRFFTEAFSVLRPGGRLIFSAFHPELAQAGIEANFEREGTEYRLGAERYSVADYLNHMWDAGFHKLECREYRGDEQLAREVPTGAKYLGRPLLLLVQAEHPA